MHLVAVDLLVLVHETVAQTGRGSQGKGKLLRIKPSLAIITKPR
jgi:hypothetical protein